MSPDIFKIKIKATVSLIFVMFIILILFLGESYFSYSQWKESILLDAKEKVTHKIAEIEQVLESDLGRLQLLKNFRPTQDNLDKFYNNSAINFLYKYDSKDSAIYMYLLWGDDFQGYTKYGLLLERVFPENVILHSKESLKDFKIYIDAQKIYFIKGIFLPHKVPCLILLSQNTQEFINATGVNSLTLSLNGNAGAKEIALLDIGSQLKSDFKGSWWQFFYQNRLSSLLYCFLYIGMALLAFLLCAHKMFHYIQNKYQTYCIQQDQALTLQSENLNKEMSEHKYLKNYFTALTEAKDARQALLKAIFPGYLHIIGSLQDLQRAYLSNSGHDEIDKNLKKFSESIKEIEHKNRVCMENCVSRTS